MGRPAQFLTPKVEDYGCVLDLAWLRRKGNCAPGHTGRITWSHCGVEKASVGYTVDAGGLRLRYLLSSNSTAGAIIEVLPIVTTATQFGGRRHWFSCPACARRCRILYGADRFRCRECLKARYESQYENEAMRITSRRWRLRRQLEERGGAPWPGGLDEGFPPKPPTMHWKTYRRLLTLDRQLELRWNAWIQDWLLRTDPRVRQADPLLQLLEKETAPAERFPHNSATAAGKDRPA